MKNKKEKSIPKYKLDFPAKKEHMTMFDIVFGAISFIVCIVALVVLVQLYNEGTETTNWSKLETITAIATVAASLLSTILAITAIIKAFIFDKRYIKPVKAIDVTAGLITFFFGVAQIIILALIYKDKFSVDTKELASAGMIMIIILMVAVLAIVVVNIIALIFNKKKPKKIAIRIKGNEPAAAK